jgi:hypothetical protein
MKRSIGGYRTPGLLLGMAGLLSLALAGAARADDLHTARVSDVSGNLSVRGDGEETFSYLERNGIIREGDTLWTDDKSRAEVELESGSWLRLAEDTKLDVRALPLGTEFRLWNGSVYLDVSERVTDPVRVMTPAGDVDVEPDSVVRVDLNRSESVRVSVLNGHARIRPDHGRAVAVDAGDRIYLDASRDLEEPTRFSREDRDSFDNYHRDRVEYYIDRPLPRELDRDILGARDLNDYGSWVVVDRTSYWRPRCEPDWRPYSTGYWSYVPGCGYSWIDYSPWGYATSHYGRWHHRDGYGWLWSPGTIWAPAYVSWSSYDNYYGWCPLDPWDRPCSYGSGFALGIGINIGLGSWTFCDRDRFYYGRHHRDFGGHTLFSGNEVHLRPGQFHLIGRDAGGELGVPRSSVRGLLNRGGASAPDRVARLEGTLPAGRLSLIQNRYQVSPNRDRTVVSRPSQAERFQRDPTSHVDSSQLQHGNGGLAGTGGLRRTPPAASDPSLNRGSDPGVRPGSGSTTRGSVERPAPATDGRLAPGGGFRRDGGLGNRAPVDRGSLPERGQTPAPSRITPPADLPARTSPNGGLRPGGFDRDSTFRRDGSSSGRSVDPGTPRTAPRDPAPSAGSPSRNGGSLEQGGGFRRSAPGAGDAGRSSYRDFPGPASTPREPAPSRTSPADRDGGYRRSTPDVPARGSYGSPSGGSYPSRSYPSAPSYGSPAPRYERPAPSTPAPRYERTAPSAPPARSEPRSSGGDTRGSDRSRDSGSRDSGGYSRGGFRR